MVLSPSIRGAPDQRGATRASASFVGCFTLGRPSQTAHFGLKCEKGILDSRCLLYPLAADVLCLRGEWAIARAPSETSTSWPLINCRAPRQAADTRSYRVAPLRFCRRFSRISCSLSKTLGGARLPLCRGIRAVSFLGTLARRPNKICLSGYISECGNKCVAGLVPLKHTRERAEIGADRLMSGSEWGCLGHSGVSVIDDFRGSIHDPAPPLRGP